MAIFVTELAGALLFSRWVPHKPKEGGRVDPNYKDGYIRRRGGRPVSPRMAGMVLRSGIIHQSVLTPECRPTTQERTWIFDALNTWKASGYRKLKALYK